MLDLFVTLTDYYGYQELVQIHDPPLIHELDHHHVLHFTYRRHSNGDVESDFELDNAPGLAFAARATSSFPGAFPPARIVEMDEVVAQRQGSWPRRAEFIAKEFPAHLRAEIDPATASFLDGSVLNNRPFLQAISAIHGRPAYREVDRRLVYIDPHPAPPVSPRRQQVPGFFATLRGALSDIPSSQPVTDELARVIEFNDQVRRLRAIIDSARPHVSELVTQVVTTTFDRAISTDDVRGWREQVNAHVARDAGFAYQAYVRLKLASVRAFGAELIVKLRGMPAQSPLSRLVAEIIDAWAVRKGIVYARADSAALEFETQTADHLPAWVKYLLAFDVKYRERRLQFLIEGQNRLYQLLGQERFAGFNPIVIDRLKREFYARLDALRRRESAAFYSDEVRALVADIFPAEPSSGEAKHLVAYASRFVEQHADKLDRLIERLAAEIDLDAKTRELDDLLASLDPKRMASRGAARGADQLSGLSVLGRADVPDHQRAPVRRAQRNPDRPHQPAGRPCAQGLRRQREPQGRRLRSFRRILLARLSRERLSPRPTACPRPADRHRLRRRRDRAQGPRRDRRAGAQETRLRAHSRCGGEASHPQQAADRQPAARVEELGVDELGA